MNIPRDKLPATPEIPFAVARKEFLRSEIQRLKSELAQSAHAISEYLQVHRDVRVVCMEGRTFTKVTRNAMGADPLLSKLESEQHALLAQWARVLDEHGRL